MIKRQWKVVAVAGAVLLASVADAQYPILEAVANRVIEKYNTATCEQLWQDRGKPKSPEEQRVIGILKGDQQMQQAFLNKVAGPIANKLFSCGIIP